MDDKQFYISPVHLYKPLLHDQYSLIERGWGCKKKWADEIVKNAEKDVISNCKKCVNAMCP